MRKFVLLAGLIVAAAMTGRAEVEVAADKAVDLRASPDLPAPFGVALTYYWQSQDQRLRAMQLNLPGISLDTIPGLDITSDVRETDVEVDYWLLPFWNVFGLLGKISGTTDVNTPLLPDRLTIDYDGVVYGAGTTVAAGWKALFGALTFTYTSTDLDSSSSVTAWILTPKVGVSGRLGAVYLGSMYQRYDEKHEGRVKDVPGFGDVDYNVEMEQQDEWNVLAGAVMGLGRHWTLAGEAGFVNRTAAQATATFRF